MNLFLQLFRDEHGFVLSAETMLLGTVGVIGATVGLSAAAKSVNDELSEVAMAIRSVDQSFHIDGASSCGACVAGSTYQQRPVEESLKELRLEIDTAQAEEHTRLDQAQKSAPENGEQKLDKEGNPLPPTGNKPHKHRKKHRKPKHRDQDESDDQGHDKEDSPEDDKDPGEGQDETSV